MNYVGIDIGSTASKVAVQGEKELCFVLPTGWSSKETTLTIKEKLLEDGIDVLSEDTKVAATGYGRKASDHPGIGSRKTDYAGAYYWRPQTHCL